MAWLKNLTATYLYPFTAAASKRLIDLAYLCLSFAVVSKIRVYLPKNDIFTIRQTKFMNKFQIETVIGLQQNCHAEYDIFSNA